MRDPRFDCLFEPLQIGPVTTKNRFYQVPHCSGMGWMRPKTLAAMRGMKAEGGWGVVCTEYCSVHPTSDDAHHPTAALWDASDIRANALMTEAVHEHGALAGVELWLGGSYIANLLTRTPPIGLRSMPAGFGHHRSSAQSRRADKQDIRNLRDWHAAAARRALEAGFDIVYVYATHGYLLSEFLDATINDRTDEYGGSLENRVRLVRELIEETREIVEGKAALAVRFSTTIGDAESYDAFGMLADLPDLWDLTVDDYTIEMGASRFVKEAALEESVGAARKLTGKPVVAVGRFTSPDTMVRVVRQGVQDLIGAARPSIADPFLPQKIADGRIEDIRECIGCNICYAHNYIGVPIRCTQNPTMGEEWRRGWHPERAGRAAEPGKVLVIGAGPAGLEAARTAGERGHTVMLAEATKTLGGRVTRECALRGLSEWARVRDWRVGQIDKLETVEVFRESAMTVEDALGVGARHILIATGARWTTDGAGQSNPAPFERTPDARVLDPNALLAGEPVDLPAGSRVLIYDDEHYYIAGALAHRLREMGYGVAIATPLGRVGSWTALTEETRQATAALIEADVELVTDKLLVGFDGAQARLACAHTDRETFFAADAVLPVTRREPQDSLYYDLIADADRLRAADVATIARIGDCDAPAMIANAVYSGHVAAMALGQSDAERRIADAALSLRDAPET